MDRAEATGFGVAAAGHLALLAAMSLGFATAVKPPILSEPMEISIVEEVGPTSAAPDASLEAPAPKLAEIEGPVEPSLPPPVIEPVPEPLPQPKATPAPPKPAPKPVAKAVPKPVARPTPPKPAVKPKAAPTKPAPAKPVAKARPAPAKPAPARPTGRLSGLLDGVSEKASDSRSTAPRAKVASAAVQSSLKSEILRQLKPHWKAPTGADAEQLRTELSITLAPNGRVTNVDVIRTTGQTESNRPQVKLHQEQAVKAARLASPFRLPAEYYDAWKLLRPIGFDKRLSQ